LALASTLPIRGTEPRILIVRLSALGDIVFATSLLEGLRQRWPRAHIAWMAQAGFASILEGDARLDELIRVPADIFKKPSTWMKLRRALEPKVFDWVIDAQGLAKSRLLTALVPGAVRIGFDSKEPLGFLLHHRLPKGGDVRDIASEYRFLAEAITGQPAPAPKLSVLASTRAQSLADMRGRRLFPGFIALCPFTTRPQKHWMEDYWPQLAAQLDRPCVLFGGPGDVEAARRIVDAAPVPIVNLAGKTKLSEIPAWLEQAALVIGVDTGLTHIGIALGRPTLALFGSTCPYTQGAVSPLTVLYDALPCSPCKRRPTCGGRYDCLRGITPVRVAGAALALLARS
jgi:heptosyltransferase-1